ncbi:MAG: GNAT family N-acetyltransferase [Anaerolineae bacterium]
MWHIRPYQPTDRAAVFQLCGDTAHFGDPIERFFDARQLFLDTFAAYYTDIKGDHLWVADDNQTGVVGYVMGCPDTRAYYQWFKPHARRIAWRAITCAIAYSRKTAAYIWRYAHVRVPYIDLSPYPAHLHINTRAGLRGSGIGTALMKAYLNRLRRENIRGVHLETSSENKIAAPWYERAGFSVVAAHPTDLYRPGTEPFDRSAGVRDAFIGLLMA